MSPTLLESSALQAATPVVLALMECSPELRTEAIEIFQDLASGEMDEMQKTAAIALLADILFPNADPEDLLPGVDLERIERLAPSQNPEAEAVLSSMDRQESIFADKVRELMVAHGLNQSQLAEKVGIGQPAVSMMLNRQCRPQQKTIRRFAEAFGVSPSDLWPAAN